MYPRSVLKKENLQHEGSSCVYILSEQVLKNPSYKHSK